MSVIALGHDCDRHARQRSGALAGRRRRPAAARGCTPGLEIVEKIIVTAGDRRRPGPAIELGGKGVWVEGDRGGALRARRSIVAVHSLKDVPAELAPGCRSWPCRRAPIRATRIVSRSGAGLDALPAGQPRRDLQPAPRLPAARPARRSRPSTPARQRRHAAAQGRRGGGRRGRAGLCWARPARLSGSHHRAARAGAYAAGDRAGGAGARGARRRRARHAALPGARRTPPPR